MTAEERRTFSPRLSPFPPGFDVAVTCEAMVIEDTVDSWKLSEELDDSNGLPFSFMAPQGDHVLH